MKVTLTWHRSLTASVDVEVDDALAAQAADGDTRARDRIEEQGLTEWERLVDNGHDPEEERCDTDLFDSTLWEVG